jgi:hypothetical protein
MKKWIFAALSCATLCGCSSYLTRGKAADMIFSEEVQFRMPITVSIPIGPVWKAGENYQTKKCSDALSPEILWAKNQGFVQIQDGNYQAIVTLTDKGKREQSSTNGPSKDNPCQTSDFVIAQRGKPNVTGVLIDGASAKVDFAYEITLENGSEQLFSAPSDLSESGKRDLDLQLDTIPTDAAASHTEYGAAIFKKYDDGWRIERVRINSLDLPN